MQIMRVVLGETCSRFRPGPDGGRDGWFQGQATKLLREQNKMDGNFVVQCKHTSSHHQPLEKSDLAKEIKKVEPAAAKNPFHFVLMTNRQVTAPHEQSIREAFESINGVGQCLVLGESWIEDTIDAHPRLLRLAPRLYGIGDLSQILSSVIQKQTEALLEDLAHSLRTFVPTDSYRRAEQALHEHRFVVLVGPPASGKSAIAANLCMVSIAQNPDERVLRIEHADQFKSTWSPADANTIYWVDDVFGETTLDSDRLREWSIALDKVEAARKRGARIVFCTRDYILAAASRQLKQSKLDIINDARVRVDVTVLSDAERDAILYNHVKCGDLAYEQKRSLKRYLSMLARLPQFSPELARRLGSQRFHSGLEYNEISLLRFFLRPVQHLRDIIHGLSGSEMAALAVCLLSNNSVPDPVPDDALADAVLMTYGVPMHQVREAFELLEGSLVRRVRSTTTQTWQFHHPSMIEALQEDLAAKSSQLVLYLQSARLPAILRDTTTLPPEPDSRLVFLTDSVYEQLVRRFETAEVEAIEGIASYLVTKASDQFLSMLDIACASVIDRALSILPEPESADLSVKLAVRLSRVEGTVLLSEARQLTVTTILGKAAAEYGWAGFADVVAHNAEFLSFFHEFLEVETSRGFPSIDRLYDWYAQDLSSLDHLDSAQEGMNQHVERLHRALSRLSLLSPEVERRLAEEKAHVDQRIGERRAEIEDDEDRRAEFDEDYRRERWSEDRYEQEHGRFADVDE